MGLEDQPVIPPPPPPPIERVPMGPVLKERSVSSSEELSAREYSKREMGEERARLAAEIKAERKQGRDKLSELRVRTSLLKNKVERSGDSEPVAAELAGLESERSKGANSLAGRVARFLRIGERTPTTASEEVVAEDTEEVSGDLEESIDQLVDTDSNLESLKERISAHYAEAGEQAGKSVEQVMLRNNAFLVHTINENPALRHNANSNVSAEATFDDDIDILLALEPSVSASSVQPGTDEDGRVSGLWSHSGGVLIAGGKITAASEQDVGTLSKGIKQRHAFSESDKSIEEIDAVVQNSRKTVPGEIGGYNELVVDNPEIAGYFKAGAMDDQGTFWAYNLSTREELEKIHALYARSPNSDELRGELDLFNRNLSRYRDRFNAIKAKGLPFYVMTPDRRFFEVLAVQDNGVLDTGPELLPEHAAHGRAGLPPEKRKELGKDLLERKVFRNAAAQQEAERIVEELDT